MLKRLIAACPYTTLALIIFPCSAGLLGALLPAFNYFPELGLRDVSLEVFARLFDDPQVLTAGWRTLWTAMSATILAYALSVAIFAWLHHRGLFSLVRTTLSPLLSIPHVTFAIAIVFLLSGHGWLTRVTAFIFDWQLPPERFLFPDQSGGSFVLVLALRELPFIFLMMMASLNNIPFERYTLVLKTCQYHPIMAWLISVQPAIHKQMLLPLCAVLVFSLSVVDVAVLIAPQQPALLQVLMLQWYRDSDLVTYLPLTAAASLVYLVITPLALALLWFFFRAIASIYRRFLVQGWRGHILKFIPVSTIVLLPIALIYLGLLLLVIWSFCSSWRYPNLLPSMPLLHHWDGVLETFLVPFFYSTFIALASSLLATLLVVLSLEAVTTGHRKRNWSILRLTMITLVVPQTALLFGMQIFFSRIFFSPTFSLIWSHLLFVLPYCLLALSGPWMHFNQQYLRTAACFGMPAGTRLLRIRLPMMLHPILTTWAVGFSVSLALYLPNQLIARIPTLTTEAIILASGGNMRVIGQCGVLQMILPLIGFFLANFIPKYLRRRKRWNVSKVHYGFRLISD